VIADREARDTQHGVGDVAQAVAANATAAVDADGAAGWAEADLVILNLATTAPHSGTVGGGQQ